MQTVCPITDKRIDENVARINAFFTLILVLAFLLFSFWPGIVLLLADFVIRGFIDSRYSIICKISKLSAKAIGLTNKTINAGPKIFAAQVGLLFSVVIITAYFSSYIALSQVAAAILGFFSFLEMAFNFCVACKLYPLIRSRS